MASTMWLSKLHLPKWLLVILALVFLLRIPSFFEPYYYGDEMIYMTLGQGVRQGLTLYKDIHDNKPPLLYLLAAISENLFTFKAILCFWSLGTIILFYKLSQTLFPKNLRLKQISTLIFAIFTTIPLFEGSIINSELFMIGFTIAALLILLKTELTAKKIYIAGVLFGLGTLFKIPAAFDMPVIIVYWLITNGLKDIRKTVYDTVFLGLGFMTPILISFGWYALAGALPEYLKAAFLQNVGYLSSFRPGDVQKPFYIRNAPLLTRALIVVVSSGLLYILRKKISKNFILLSLWTIFGLFAVTLSERPYPHYFIQVIPEISLLLGIFFTEQSVEQSLVVLPLTLAFFVPYFYKFYHYDTVAYYKRFIDFADKTIDKGTYFQNFAPMVNRNYQIADFLLQSSLKTDRVFMWDSDSSVVYALSRRLPPIKYVADYHINDYSNTAEVASLLLKNPPKFIITTPNRTFPELDSLIKNKYLLISQIENANIFVRRDLGN